MELDLLYNYFINNPFEFIVLLLGVVYIILEFFGNKWMWFIGFLMAVLSLYVFVDNEHYWLGAIQVYQIALSIYGFWKWQFGRKKTLNHDINGQTTARTEQPITRMPKRAWCLSLLSVAAITVILALLNDSLLKNELPWADAAITAFNLVAVVLLSQKYLEQWFFWLVYDSLMIVVSLVEGRMYFYIVLCVIYIITSIFGYFKWRRMMLESQTN